MYVVCEFYLHNRALYRNMLPMLLNIIERGADRWEGEKKHAHDWNQEQEAKPQVKRQIFIEELETGLKRIKSPGWNEIRIIPGEKNCGN